MTTVSSLLNAIDKARKSVRVHRKQADILVLQVSHNSSVIKVTNNVVLHKAGVSQISQYVFCVANTLLTEYAKHYRVELA